MLKNFVVEPKILLFLGIKVIAAFHGSVIFPLFGWQIKLEEYKE